VIPSPAVPDPSAEESLRSLLLHGCAQAEVYLKRGRSRRCERTLDAESALMAEERGWAVRAGTRRGAFFVAGSGQPPPEGPWPEPAAGSCDLPASTAPPSWTEPSDFEAPLIGERDGLGLLAAVARELEQELAGARLLAGALEDGSSEAQLLSSRGTQTHVRHRLATLYLQAAGPGREPAVASLYLAEREARRFLPRQLGRRLADRLSIVTARTGPTFSEGPVLLAPPVASHLVSGLMPFLIGSEAPARGRALRDRRGRVGSVALTLIDDGRLPGGVFEAPCDGEGVPCREIVLIEEGVFRQPLLAWWEARDGSSSGCSRRAGWRDLPRRGPTHLYVRADAKVSVTDLLATVDHGHYLLETVGAGRFAVADGRFSLPVCGLVIEKGRAIAPLGQALLTGTISDLLHGIVAAARDLAFHPYQGLIGSPTLLAHGLEISPVSDGSTDGDDSRRGPS
jgi:predicted Zn-dependent protease